MARETRLVSMAVLVTLCCCLFVGGSWAMGSPFEAFVGKAAHSGQARTIALAAATIDTTLSPQFHSEDSVTLEWLRGHPDATSHQFMMNVKGPITARTRRSLEAHLGRSLGHYIPDNTFVFVGSERDARRMATHMSVLWIGLYKPAFRLSPSLGSTIKSDPKTGLQELHVLLARGVEANVDDIQGRLKKHGALVVKVSAVKLAVYSSAASRDKVIEVLSLEPRVHWIADAPIFTVRNKYASWIVQGGAPNQHPVWAQGLNGTGQIIGIADTGMDYSSCFFTDPNVAVPLNTVSTTHRKIVTYIDFVDGVDYIGGHGTHVCGSAIGSAMYSSPSLIAESIPFNGMAPGAKIAFTDIGDQNGGLMTPPSLGDPLLGPVYTAGARIHSDSWGSADPSYTLEANEIDEFMYEHPDMLVFIAAGNDGENGYITVGTPATAKNVVAVGASQSDYTSFEAYFSAATTSLSVTVSGVTSEYVGVLADFSPDIQANVVGQMAFPSNDPLGCASSLTGVSGKIALINRGTCNFVDKAANAQKSGAIALVVINNVAGDPIVMGGTVSGIALPSIMVNMNAGAPLVAALKGAYTSYIGPGSPPDLSANPEYARNNMAYFSSRGPTIDTRFKPDVVAPGFFIFSALSNGPDPTSQCGVAATLGMAGTSMATPVLAGNALLVRQYLVSGMGAPYASRASSALPTATPSASLVKAFVVAAARGLTGNIDLMGLGDPTPMTQFGATPNLIEGHGLVQLNNSLKFSNSPFDLFYHDEAQGLTTGAHKDFCFTASSSGPVYLTLVWTDPPASPSAFRALISDLDLIVSSGSGTVYLGNNLEARTSNGNYPYADSVNNVEKVIMTAAAGESLYVRVLGANVPEAAQTFSLVVTGDFTSSPSLSRCVMACPSACSGVGTCQPSGECLCPSGHGGADCSMTPASALVDGSKVSGFVTTGAWAYYKLDVEPPNEDSTLVLSFTSLTAGADPDFYVGLDYLPTFTEFEVYNNENDMDGDTKREVIITDPSKATYYVGVYGYCCVEGRFTMSAAYGTTTAEPIHLTFKERMSVAGKHYGRYIGGIFLGLAIVFIVVGAGHAIVWYVQHRQKVALYNHLVSVTETAGGVHGDEEIEVEVDVSEVKPRPSYSSPGPASPAAALPAVDNVVV